MEFLKDKFAVVTGAASGIGRAIAIALAEQGVTLHLCDVNEVALKETAELVKAMAGGVATSVVDVGKRDQMEAFAAKIHDERPAVDILVNNAGIAVTGSILHTSLDDFERIIETNLMGVIYGCKLFAPAMVKRGTGGHIVNISSMLGFHRPPALSAYVASKHGVLGFSESIRADLLPHKIGVSTICPGRVITNIIHAAPLRGLEGNEDRVRKRIVKFYEQSRFNPDKVAVAVLDAIGRNRAIVPVTPEAWSTYFMERFFPGVSHWIGRKLSERISR